MLGCNCTYSSFLRLQPGLDQCAAFVAVEMAADVVQRARLRKLSRAAVIIADLSRPRSH